MPELFASKWDATRGAWKSEAGVPPTPARAVKYFSRIRTVSQDKKTGLVSIQIEWKDPKRAADWANELASRINDEMRARVIEKAAASVSFLEKELSSTAVVETRDAINRLLESQIKQQMLANVTHEYAFRVVDRGMAPDMDDPVRPQVLLLILMGPMVGLAFGIVLVLAFELLLLPNNANSA
jgi:capsular polysaccharide biosynthesis protein